MDLAQAAAQHPHLAAYLKRLEDENRPAPQFSERLLPKWKDQPVWNFLYAVGGSYFIHLERTGGMFPAYTAIEPGMGDEDVYLAYRKQLFMDAPNLGEMASRKDYGDALDREAQAIREKKQFKGRGTALAAARFLVYRDLVEHGPLEPLMKDPWIEDIHALGTKSLMCVHKIFGMCETTIKFRDEQHLEQFLVSMGERIGRPPSDAVPIIDGALPDGSRINIVFGRAISHNGTSFTIRKFSEVPTSVVQLMAWGTLSPMLGAYLWLCLEHGMNVFVSGETASGKTTTLNSILPFIRRRSKIMSAEDTPEVIPPHKNWQQLVTRERSDQAEGAVKMYDLLKAGLRSRPNYIIVGEIRGAEGAVAIQAMQAGHSTMATFHASSVGKLIQRFTSPPISVPIHFMDNLNVVLVQMAVHLKGRRLRRVLAVEEIEGFDRDEQSVATRQVFTWDPHKDTLRFGGRNNSYVLEDLIAPRLGMQDRREIYRLLDERTEYLKGLLDDGIVDYPEVASRIFGLDPDEGTDAAEGPSEDAPVVRNVRKPEVEA